MRKRMLALLLAVVMAAGLLPAAALAENTAVSSIQLGDYVQVLSKSSIGSHSRYCRHELTANRHWVKLP